MRGSRQKVLRANEHIEALGALQREYVSRSPFRLERIEDSPTGPISYVLRIAEAIPESWSAVAGDAIHNLRSSLDHLACDLVATGGGVVSESTAFPMSRTAASLKQTIANRLRGATSEAHTFARRLKPYPGGNRRLAQLHALDIADKHHALLIAGAAHREIIIEHRMTVPWQDEPMMFPPLALRPADRQFPLRDGAEVLGVAAAVRTAGLPFEEPKIAIELCIGTATETAGYPLMSTLQDLSGYVARMLDIADRWFF